MKGKGREEALSN